MSPDLWLLQNSHTSSPSSHPLRSGRPNCWAGPSWRSSPRRTWVKNDGRRRRAQRASDRDESEGAWREHPDTLASIANLAFRPSHFRRLPETPRGSKCWLGSLRITTLSNLTAKQVGSFGLKCFTPIANNFGQTIRCTSQTPTPMTGSIFLPNLSISDPKASRHPCHSEALKEVNFSTRQHPQSKELPAVRRRRMARQSEDNHRTWTTEPHFPRLKVDSVSGTSGWPVVGSEEHGRVMTA